MKYRYNLVIKQIMILLVTVCLGGPIAVVSAADVTVPKGTTKKTSSSVTSGTAVRAQGVQKTAADKAQEQKITDTLRQMGFNVTGISRAANGQYNVRVNKFDAAKATNAFKGVLAFRGAARQIGVANMNRGLNNASRGADVDSVPTPGGGATGGPSIGDFEGGTGGRPGGGLGGDGLGPGGDGIGPGNDGTGGGGIGPGDGGIGPGDDGPGGGGIGPGDNGPGGGGVGPGDNGPGGGGTGPGNPTGPDGGGGNPPPGDGGGSGGDGGGGNPSPGNGSTTGGGGNPPEQEDGGTPPTDPDDGTDRVLSRDTASRSVARGNAQIAAGRTALTTGGTAVLSVTVSNTGVLSISRQSLANAGLNNQVPSAANGNVMFH